MRNAQMMPQAKLDRPATNIKWELSPQALAQWDTQLMAAAPLTDTTISVLDAIGVDPWTGEGVTLKRISAALRAIGPKKDITVNINSPGGDLFEGFGIYNALREYDGTITVKVLGVAASAASIIAMAGDEIQIARAGFLMVHNTWVMAIGNRNDLRAVADTLEPFDAAMADIYSARSGLDVKKVSRMMDSETWINGTSAVDQGFADSLLPSDDVKKSAALKQDRAAAHTLDVVLAKAGMPRSERRKLFQEFKSGTPGAAGSTTTPNAGDDRTPSAAEVAATNETMAALRSFSVT